MLHLGVSRCKMCQNQKAFHLWAGEIFVLNFIPCVCVLYVLERARALQFSFLVELIAGGKCKLYEASATPDSLFSSLCRKLCVWLWHLIRTSWLVVRRKGRGGIYRGKKCKKRKSKSLSLPLVVRPVCIDHSFSEWTPLRKSQSASSFVFRRVDASASCKEYYFNVFWVKKKVTLEDDDFS